MKIRINNKTQYVSLYGPVSSTRKTGNQGIYVYRDNRPFYLDDSNFKNLEGIFVSSKNMISTATMGGLRKEMGKMEKELSGQFIPFTDEKRIRPYYQFLILKLVSSR